MLAYDDLKNLIKFLLKCFQFRLHFTDNLKNGREGKVTPTQNPEASFKNCHSQHKEFSIFKNPANCGLHNYTMRILVFFFLIEGLSPTKQGKTNHKDSSNDQRRHRTHSPRSEQTSCKTMNQGVARERARP